MGRSTIYGEVLKTWPSRTPGLDGGLRSSTAPSRTAGSARSWWRSLWPRPWTASTTAGWPVSSRRHCRLAGRRRCGHAGGESEERGHAEGGRGARALPDARERGEERGAVGHAGGESEQWKGALRCSSMRRRLGIKEITQGITCDSLRSVDSGVCRSVNAAIMMPWGRRNEWGSLSDPISQFGWEN
jgi:hypothetical protein